MTTPAREPGVKTLSAVSIEGNAYTVYAEATVVDVKWRLSS